MSRSYMKFPVVKDKSGPSKKFAKRLSSKAVRRYSSGIHAGRMYRKIFCSWIINDFWFYKSFREAIRDWETSDVPAVKAKTKKQIINEWAKYYYRK